MHAWDFREPANAWTHLAGLVLAVPGVALLLARCGEDLGKRLSLIVYGFGLVWCYTASTLYHGIPLPADRLTPFVRLDSAGIFALIAGTYTPLAWNLLRGRWRAWTLASVWTTAVVSVALIVSDRPFSPIVGNCLYLVMGWGFVACYAKLAKVVSHRALSLIILGGLSYTVGAVINLLVRPSLEGFGAHAVFHLFVITGSLCHYAFILGVVVPFDRESDR